MTSSVTHGALASRASEGYGGGMSDRNNFRLMSLARAAGLGLTLTACGSEGPSEASGSTSADTGSSTDAPTSPGPTDDTPVTSGESITGSGSDTDANTATSAPTSTTGDSETQSVDPSDSTTNTTTATSAEDTGTSSTGGDTSTGSDAGTSTTGDESSATGDESSTTNDTNDCMPSENPEVSCDNLDNDCNGQVDDIDVGGDGICDCLNIGILGTQGFAPTSNFEAWVEDKGSAVTRTLLQNNPGVVTPAFLDNYDVVLIDRIERQLSADEAAALGAFVKQKGRGVITLIGYNFDNNNPAPERDRANTALAPFGLAYQGGYFGNNVVPTFVANHPVSEDIADVNFNGGIMPVDTGMQGTSTVFATYQGMNAGIAHQTTDGGRVIVWGDEWITFDAVWLGYVDVEAFWVNMFDWVRPQDICSLPQ